MGWEHASYGRSGLGGSMTVDFGQASAGIVASRVDARGLIRSQEGTDMFSAVSQGLGAIDGEPSPSSGPATQSLDQILSSIEKREIVAALRRANGQRTLAAQYLVISRSRLYRRMEALGIATEAPSPHL